MVVVPIKRLFGPARTSGLSNRDHPLRTWIILGKPCYTFQPITLFALKRNNAMLTWRMILRCLFAIGLATVARAQAAVEYAAKSSAVPAAGSGMHVGVCALDTMFVPCVRHFYPLAFYTAIVAACVTLAFFVSPKSRG